MLKDYIASAHPIHNRDEFFKTEWGSIWTQKNLQQQDSLRKDELASLLTRYLDKEGPILEAGCGTGKYVRYLWKRGYDIRGIEYESEIVSRLRRECPGVPIDEGDLRRLPYAGNSFRWYVSLGVIEHYEEGPDEILAEAVRVLCPGGKIFLTVPFVSIPLLFERWFERCVNRYSSGTNMAAKKFFWQYRFTKREILDLVSSYGFEVEKVHYTSVMKGFYDRIDFVRAMVGTRQLRHRKLPVSISRYTVLPILRPFAHMILVVAMLSRRNVGDPTNATGWDL